jgi:hypothetical protein
MEFVNLAVDSRKRISLTKLLPNLPVSSVKAHLEGDKIILEPMVEIPAAELWLYKNREALNKVHTGLSQKGSIKRGSFKEHVE